MTAGLGVLKLAPAHFWSMTPRELAAALGTHVRAMSPPTRSDLQRLMQQFPDKDSACDE